MSEMTTFFYVKFRDSAGRILKTEKEITSDNRSPLPVINSKPPTEQQRVGPGRGEGDRGFSRANGEPVRDYSESGRGFFEVS